MSDAQIRCSLQINKSNLQYRSYPTDFSASLTGSNGPTPGAITISTTGTNIDLSELTTPGLCVFKNIDDTHFITIGPYDPESNLWYPMIEILAGEIYVVRLSRNLGNEYATGTGTVGPSTNTFRAVADTAASVLVVDAFEK